MSKLLENLKILSKDKKAKTGPLIIAQLIADGFDAIEVLPYFMNAPTRKAKESAAAVADSVNLIAPYFDELVMKIRESNGISTVAVSNVPQGYSEPDTFDPTSKESIIAELQRQYHDAVDPKQKSDILVKIAELQRMKQEEVKEEKRHTMVYLPATCHDCPCLLEVQKEHPDIKPLSLC